MKRFTWKHAAAGLALMAALSLVAPVPAQAAAGRSFGEPVAWSGGGWAWIASLWDQLAAWLGGAAGGRSHATPKTDPGSGISSSPGDLNSTINPDGTPAHP
jgi:hypothetical protein